MTTWTEIETLWSFLIDEFRSAGKGTAEAERHARRAVSIVRNQRDQAGVVSWGPGEQIPAEVVWVYDLDGDVWTREPGGQWSMTGFDPDEVEDAAGQEYDDDGLLDRYGPVTGTSPSRRREPKHEQDRVE